MKQLNYKKIMRITAGTLTALIIFRAVVFFTARPKITVDYVAEYNRFSLPENYNPENNAAELYQKAFDAFIELPEDHRHLTSNQEEEKLLRKWLNSNTKAFDYFKKASVKPYWWIECFSETSPPDLGKVQCPEFWSVRSIGDAFILDSGYKAEEKQYETAFDNLLTCYRAGRHMCRPNQFVVDQRIGTILKNEVLQCAFDLLDQYQIECDMLQFLQAAFVNFLRNDSGVPSIRADTFFVLDITQQTFVYSRKGHGRWAWRNKYHESVDLFNIPDWNDNYEALKERFYLCLIAPTQSQVVQKLEEITNLSDRMMPLTPWELKQAPVDYQKIIQDIVYYHGVLDCADFGTNIWRAYHETKARTNALIVVLAALRYHQNSGRYPQSLQELVGAGYLQSLPMDPYSDGPLVYRVTEDGFTLYSVGEDFVDNSAVVTFNSGFSTPRRKVLEINRPDIVYWPVYREEDFPAPPADPNEMRNYGPFFF